jgi:hypothetical protein
MASAARWQDAAPLDGRRARPRLESAPSGIHRLFDERRVGGAQAGDDRPIGWWYALELRPVTVDELAIDEVTTERLSAHRAIVASNVHVALSRRHRRASATCTDFNSLGS